MAQGANPETSQLYSHFLATNQFVGLKIAFINIILTGIKISGYN
jgi:hypothetical protein